jgi:hypothetical protein
MAIIYGLLLTGNEAADLSGDGLPFLRRQEEP